MDQGIGRVLRQVRQTGQEDNTLIVFLADNGGCHEERIADEQVWVAPGPREPARTLPARVIRRHIVATPSGRSKD